MTPRIEELINLALASRFAELHVHGFATVDTFDSTERTCTCTPVVRRPVPSDAEDGTILFEDSPAVQNVPVLFLGGANFSLTWDVAPGDTVLLAYLDFSPLAWRSKGEPGEPPELTQSGPSYPVALPVFRPRGAAGPAKGTADGVAVRVEGAALRVGEGLQPVALADLVAAQLEALVGAISGAAVVANDGGAAFKANILAALDGWPASVAASNLRADP